MSVGNEAELRLQFGDVAASATLALQGLRAASAIGDVGLACDNLLRLAANPTIGSVDRRAIHRASMELEADLRRPHELAEFRVVGLENRCEGVDGDDRESTPRTCSRRCATSTALTSSCVCSRPLAIGWTKAPSTIFRHPPGCAGRSVRARRVAAAGTTGDQRDDDGLRARGLELYRTTPFAACRAALEELGVHDAPTEVTVPARASEPDDPVYSVEAVLDVVHELDHR